MIDSRAGIIGLAVGDAMGVPLEFCIREKLMQHPTTEMLGYGSHDVPKGSWSDDSSMTFATVDAIVKERGINCNTIAINFLDWMRNAKWTPTDRVFDIGRTCLQAIAKFELKQDIAEKCGGTSEMNNGNGSLMRILPLTYYCFAKKMEEQEIFEVVRKVSSITHGHEISIMGCFIYVMYGIELLNNRNLIQAYKKIKKIKYNTYFSEETIKKYERILKKDISKYDLDEIKSTGYVIDTLEATLWVLLNTKSYNQSIIGAINLGNDTDTIGACVGGLSGIHYGLQNIDIRWQSELLKYNEIVELCNKFNSILNQDEIIEVVNVDITEMNVDAIVNAANNELLRGGGLCGAIFNKSGFQLDEECKKIGYCDTGDAVITKGYNLKAKYVIHAVAPVWYMIKNEEEKRKLLRNCYKNIFKVAIENNIKTIAIPCMGTGIYQCPISVGKVLAFDEANKIKDKFEKIFFVCYRNEEYEIYTNMK